MFSVKTKCDLRIKTKMTTIKYLIFYSFLLSTILNPKNGRLCISVSDFLAPLAETRAFGPLRGSPCCKADWPS